MNFGNNIDGQAQTEMELVYPDGNQIVLTQGRVNYAESKLVEIVGQAAVYKHQMTTINPSIVDSILKASMTSGEPLFRFRLGFGNPEKTEWLPWQLHTIVGYAAMLVSLNNQSGHTVEIETSDRLYVMSAQNRTVARRGTVSEIVTAIAEHHGLEHVIEPTQGSLLLIQSFVDDTDFIRNRLVPRAINARNRGNFLFFIRDNVLHFHTPDYETTIKEMVYYQSTATRLSQVDNSQRLFDHGNAGTVVVVYDPYTGASQQVFSNPDNTLKLADGIYNIPSTYVKPLTFTLGENRTAEPAFIGQNVYANGRAGTFELVLRATKIVDIRLGDMIRVIINPREGTATVWSGVYVVTRVVYDINKGAVSALVQLTRGEITQEKASNAVQDANRQLVPGDDAPGQPLNLQEAQSSSKTKGAGKPSSAGLFVTVESPD